LLLSAELLSHWTSILLLAPPVPSQGDEEQDRGS